MTIPVTSGDLGSASETGAAAPTEFSFANLSQVVITWLLGLGGVGDVGVDRPDPTTGPTSLPYILVTQIPGGTDNRVTARGLIDLDVFTGDPYTVITFARVVHARMLALRNQVVTLGGWRVPIGEVHTLRLPGYSQYSDDPVLMHRVIAGYEIRSDFDAQPL